MRKSFVLSIFILLFSLTGLGQSFLKKYPDLKIEDLPDFFADWKTYSDSVAVKAISEGPIYKVLTEQEIDKINTEVTTNFYGGRDAVPRYNVVYQSVRVSRYNTDSSSSELLYANIGGRPLKADSVYNVTPPLPKDGLYLTRSIDDRLGKFIGGIRDGDTITKRLDSNIYALQQYIPVSPGHWGGYWWFCSFPMITGINYADNRIIVKIRKSWHNGCEIEYLKEQGVFDFNGYLTGWIE